MKSSHLLLSGMITAWSVISPQAIVAHPAEWLPDSVIAYAEITNTPEMIDAVWQHPVRAKIEASSLVQDALKSDETKLARSVIRMLEGHYDARLHEILAQVTHGGIYAALDPKTKGVAMMLGCRDEDTAIKTREVILNIARLANLERNGSGKVESIDYRGIKAYSIVKVKMAQWDNWIMLTNQPDLGKQVIDAKLDGSENSLAAAPHFAAARKTRSSKQGWAYLHIGAVRDAGKLNELTGELRSNPVLEVVAGGILACLNKTPYVTLETNVEDNAVQVSLSMPHQDDWIDEPRQYFFAQQDDSPPPAFLLPDTIASLRTHRDFSQFWLNSGDLFTEEINDKMAEAESNLTTLFSGMDFGEEVLGAIEPGLQIIVTHQEFKKGQIAPAIKLPAFALTSRLRKPESVRAPLRRTFQSMIGFLNVANAMNGQPQLDFESIRDGQKQLVVTNYVAEKDQESDEASIYFNFSPSIAFHKEQFVLASTADLARQLIGGQDHRGDTRDDLNTSITANAKPLLRSLKENRSHLISQNMLEEGNTRDEATVAIEALFAIVDSIDQLSLDLKRASSRMELNLHVSLAQ